jgi:hypothetical protein
MESTDIQLLSMDLNSIETSLPVIRSDIYECRIAKSEIVRAEDPAKADAWKLTLETTTPAVDKDGKPVEPGHPLFVQTQLKPTGKSTMKMVVQNIATIVQALRPRLDGQVTLPIDPWYKQLEGRLVRVRVTALPARENPKVPGQMFRATNQVDEWLKN